MSIYCYLFSGPQEYCQWETFTAECPDGEMLLMKNGVYGRMSLGRCAQNNFGYLGCGSDVIDQVYIFILNIYKKMKIVLRALFLP